MGRSEPSTSRIRLIPCSRCKREIPESTGEGVCGTCRFLPEPPDFRTLRDDHVLGHHDNHPNRDCVRCKLMRATR